MKKTYIAIILLFAVVALCAAAPPSENSASKPASGSSGQISETPTAPSAPQLTTIPKPAEKPAAIFSQAEADSLRLQGDSLLAASGVNNVPVGAISTTDLIYILVVVLLVVVILRVAT